MSSGEIGEGGVFKGVRDLILVKGEGELYPAGINLIHKRKECHDWRDTM